MLEILDKSNSLIIVEDFMTNGFYESITFERWSLFKGDESFLKENIILYRLETKSDLSSGDVLVCPIARI